MGDSGDYAVTFNRCIRDFFRDAMKLSVRDLRFLPFLAGTFAAQCRARRLRLSNGRKGLHVPPVMIASVTRKCNLACKGCYARAQEHERKAGAEMTESRFREVVAEAESLGMSVILLAGGEPFMRPELIETAAKFRRIVFPVFTNGSLVRGDRIEFLRRNRNIVPVLSIEGYERETDERRGEGVFRRITSLAAELNRRGVFFGNSVTVTRSNFGLVTAPGFVRSLVSNGAKVVFYVEYVPVKEGTESLTLTEDQRSELNAMMDGFRKKFGGLFVALPGEEEKFGGCLAAGRGFVHVSPEGYVEPCPFAPFSDTALDKMPLAEALKSDFLRGIRDNHDKLTETAGGCALWTNREWVKSLLETTSEGL